FNAIFAQVLREATRDPLRRVSEISLLNADEGAAALSRWNDTRREYPTGVCLHELFEAQVKRTPLNTALRLWNPPMSYAQLDSMANQLARYLRKLGVGPDTLVGVCVERSFEMVVGLLGVLKAGGAYVPLDPTDPPERLRFMLSDSAAPVVLTQERHEVLLA